VAQLIAVVLEDGPAAGQQVRYYTPLPKVLVVATRNGRVAWHDYRRVGSCVYRYAPPQCDTPP
jgi:hypothetical protein